MARSLTHPEAPMQGPSGPPPPTSHRTSRHPRATAPERLHRSTSSEGETPRWAEHPTLSTPLGLPLGGGHQKRGDHRNDRSTAQRSQSNRLKRNRHVKTTGQFALRPFLFDFRKHTTDNLPPSAPPSQPCYDRDPRPGDLDIRSPLLPPRHVRLSPSKGSGIFARSALQPPVTISKEVRCGEPYPHMLFAMLTTVQTSTDPLISYSFPTSRPWQPGSVRIHHP